MIKNNKQALQAIELLNFSQPILKVINGKVPSYIKDEYKKPTTYYKVLSRINQIEDLTNYIPLWEMNHEGIFLLNSQNQNFYSYYYGDESFELLGENYDQFITSILIDLADSGLEEDELEEASSTFDYKHWKNLNKVIDEDEKIIQAFKEKL